MRLSLKRLARRDPSKPTLRQRAAALKASAAHVIRRRASQVTGQPEGESLPDGRLVDCASSAFTVLGAPCNRHFRLDDDPSRNSADGDARPSRENDMGHPQADDGIEPFINDQQAGSPPQPPRSTNPKKRSATLRARLNRITRGPDGSLDPQRRVMLAGSIAAALPLPAFAAAGALKHDRALFEAAARMQEAKAAFDAAGEASDAAHEAAWAELGICPPELILREWHQEIGALTWPGAPREVRCTRAIQWVRGHETDIDHASQAWTAPGLRIAIKYAVPMFGCGGRTPYRIRRWRSLIPAAEAFDARRAAAESRHRLTERSEARRQTGRIWAASQQAFDATPATTVAGLALVAHHVGQCGWSNMSPNWRNLLISAANVSGVTLQDRVEAQAPTFM